MKISLIGSQIENDFRKGLKASLGLQDFEELHASIEARGLLPEETVMLEYLPEQAEDIYTLLSKPDNILVIEVERATRLVIEESQSNLKTYLHGKSKRQQIKVLVALEVLGLPPIVV